MTLLEITQIMANIAGVIAAIGILLSLIYLSAQVRDNSRLVSENTKAQLMASDMSSNDGARQMAFEVLTNPDVASLIIAGLNNELDDRVDRYRFDQWGRSVIESHMTFFVQLERTAVTSEIFDYWSGVFDRLCRRPGLIACYERMRADLKPSFREYMDAKIATQAQKETIATPA